MTSKLLGLVAALVLGGISTAANAVSVYLQPSTQDVVLGNSFGVDVYWDFTGNATLGGGTDVTWDPSGLSFVSLVFDTNPLFDPAFTRIGDVSPGLIDGMATGSFNGLAGSGPLYIATITFQTLAAGSFAIDLSEDAGIAGPFVSILGMTYTDLTFTGGNVNVSAVPLPAAAWLMIGGLGALLGYRRKA
jgi:hypothetical protein